MSARHEINSNDVREELLNLIENAEGGVWDTARSETLMRNSFCLQLENGPIFTVTVTYGGALTSASAS